MLSLSLPLLPSLHQLISVSADSDEDLFKAVLVSIGMLGVLTEVTFQCEKSFNLREKLTVHPLDYCVENFYQLATRSEHGHDKLWLEAHSETCAVFDVRRTEQPVSVEQGVELWSWKIVMPAHVLDVVILCIYYQLHYKRSDKCMIASIPGVAIIGGGTKPMY